MINVLRATVHDGRVEASAPADRPEGTQVVFEPLYREFDCMRDEDWSTTAEGIAALMDRWNKSEPLLMTAEEEAELDAWRQKMKDYTIANMN